MIFGVKSLVLLLSGLNKLESLKGFESACNGRINLIKSVVVVDCLTCCASIRLILLLEYTIIAQCLQLLYSVLSLGRPSSGIQGHSIASDTYIQL
jgi:hypothetical protein